MTAPGTVRLPPIGFWSYARQDDALSAGRLSQLRAILVDEVQQLFGREPVRLFQDSSTIAHGSNWESEIRAAIAQSAFLVPILTPNFIQSEWCCREVELFLERVPQPKAKGRGATSTRPLLQASPYQPVERDFAFVVAADVPAEKLIRAAKGADKALIQSVSLFDVFEGGSLGAGKKSLAISVTLQAMDRTLTEQEIAAVSERIVAAVAKATGGVQRS